MVVRDEVELGDVQRGLGGQHLRVLVDADPLGQGRLRRRLADRLRAVRRRLRARRPRRREVGEGGLVGVLGRAQLFAGHRARRGERLAPLQVDAGAVEVALRRLQLRLGAQQVRVPRADLGGEGLVGGDVLVHRPHGPAVVGLRLRHSQLGVGRVDRHQHVARLHRLGVGDVHGQHRPVHLRRHRRDVRADIGVVGGDEVRAHQQPPCAVGDRADHHHGAQAGEQPLAQRPLAGGGGGRAGAGGGALRIRSRDRRALRPGLLKARVARGRRTGRGAHVVGHRINPQ